MGVFGQDLLDSKLYENGFPHRLFTGIRRDCPIAWHDPGDGPVTDGFWSVAGHPEVTSALAACEVLSAPLPTIVDDSVTSSLVELARRPGLLGEVRRVGFAVAAGELARWVCPRTVVWCRATDELPLGRHLVAPGERLALWLPSANRDERVFGRDAMDLVVGRDPNPHLSFVGDDTLAERFVAALDAALADAVEVVLSNEPEWESDVERSAVRNAELTIVRR